jgi:hypothetical protein
MMAGYSALLYFQVSVEYSIVLLALLLIAVMARVMWRSRSMGLG